MPVNGAANISTPATMPPMPPSKLSNGTPRKPKAALPDQDDPEYLRALRRPAVIKEDLWEMERRRRVQQVLAAKDFRDELEDAVQVGGGVGIHSSYSTADIHRAERCDPSSGDTRILHQIAHLLNGNAVGAPPAMTGISTSLTNLHLQQPQPGGAAVIPICDFSPHTATAYSKQERVYRCKLASLYRLVDLFHWSQGIYNHITLRLPLKTPGDPSPEILINPFGLLYNEITASSLIKLDLAGAVLDPGSTQLGINQAGYVLHSAIHEAREDVSCVLHLHTPVVSAVSSMKCGLLPICQEAIIIGPVAYHDYKGILSEEEEKKSIVEDLGDKNVMLLRNHGFVACGRSAEDALHLAFHCILACETQIRALRVGLENLIVPDETAIRRAYETARRGGGGVNRIQQRMTKSSSISKSASESLTVSESLNAGGGWQIGELEWEAWMRALDAAGYRTGHLYRQPQLRASSCTRTARETTYSPASFRHSATNLSEVAIPPSCSSMGVVDEGNEEAMTQHRLDRLRREQEKLRWLSSPNCYQQIRFLESGTSSPKVCTKWVQHKEQCSTTPRSHNSTPVKSNQFSPPGTDPREMRQRQKRLKESRLAGEMSAGPASTVLDAKIRSEDRDENKPYFIGTASKGIISRPHQHNAQVYRQLYAQNPFQSETDEDIHAYLRDMDKKSRSASSTLDRRVTDHTSNYHTYSNGTSNSRMIAPLVKPNSDHAAHPNVELPSSRNGVRSISQDPREARPASVVDDNRTATDGNSRVSHSLTPESKRRRRGLFSLFTRRSDKRKSDE